MIDQDGGDDPCVRAVWGNRSATARQVADSVWTMVVALEQVDALLTGWRLGPTTALPDADGLAAWLESSRRGELDEPWQVTLVSNGTDDRGVSVTVREGNQVDHPLYVNEVEVEPAPTFDGTAFFARHGRRLVEVVVDVWRPDCATFADSSLHRVQRLARRAPTVGGHTWFADHLGPVPSALPEGARTYRRNGGTVVDLLEPDGRLPSPDRVAEVADWLDRVGLRRPVPQVQPESAGPR